MDMAGGLQRTHPDGVFQLYYSFWHRATGDMAHLTCISE